MKPLALASLLVVGCMTNAASKTAVELDNTGRLAIVGDCVIVAEQSSLVCVPRAGGGAPYTLVTNAARTYVAIAGDGDTAVVTSLAGSELYVDRVALDGTLKLIAKAPATPGAGALALAPGAVFVSDGLHLLAVPADGSRPAGTIVTAQSPPLLAAAFRGTTLYFADGPTVYSWDLSSQTVPQWLAMDQVDTQLGADTDAAVIGRHIANSSYSFVTNVTTREITELHGTLTRIAIAGGHPYGIVDAGIVDATGTDVTDPVVAVADAYDLAVDDKSIYWITRQGTFDLAARP
jgi:hypothetical protein